MVAEDVLRQKLEEPKLSHRGPIKAVKINRKNSVEGSLGSPTSDPHRKRKFNGDKKGEDVKEDSSRKETSSPPRSHNGCMAVDPAESSEKVIQENVVSCASEHYVDPGPDCGGEIRKHDSADEDTLPVSSSILDENSNLLQEESESKHCRDKEGQNDPAEEQAFLSCRISAQESDVPPGRLAVTDDLPVQSADGRRNDHTVPSEDPVDHAEEPKDYEIAEDNKDLKENSLEEAAHSSRNGDQRSRADKKPKEHNEVKKKDRHEGKDKRDSEKDKSQEKTTDRVKAEDQEQKMAGSVKKASYAKEQKDRSKSKEDGHKDRSKSKEDGHKDRSKEDGHKDRSKSKEDRHKDRSKGDGHKDRSKEERHKDRSKEERHKASGQSKHKHLVKEETPDTHALHKENGKDTKAGVLKMTLVDLDLFQEALTEDKRHKLKDSTKGKSLDKKASGEKQKDHHKKSDDKDTKRHHSEETKGIKRELEEVVVEAEQKKIKVDPEKDEKVQEKEKSRSKASKKRKNAEDKEGETKAKRTKDAKQKEEDSKWKWWEEKNHEDGVKWKFLDHRGPFFAPPYEPLPDDVTFYYDGQPMKLSPAAEEVATFYGKMLDHEYTTKEIFQNNFFTDWRTQMTKDERKTIKHLEKCDFSEIHKYFFDKNEARKALPKEEKQKLKEETSKIQEEYGFCTLDGHREKIGNFKIEPPGLFRGRGDHPKMGMLKLRIRPEDVIINCSRDSKVPEPPPGHRWKEVRFDNTVTWLASWTENIQGSIKYIMLNPSSKLKGEKDWQKYETARRLKNVVDQIRSQYRLDWKSREMKKRQRAVALYFIDKLALRAGNEKEEGETADTVGCCSLRVEHIKLFPELDGQQYVVEFDFLGKDSIRYYNKVPVEKEVFKNLKLFLENKNPDDDLFDRLNTSIVNKHLQDLMDGLTAKVFRTYNASITLQNQLKELTNEDDSVPAKILSYNRANRAVALLCNHQRAPPKTFEKSMQNLQAKIDAKEQQLKDAKKELKKANADYKAHKNDRTKKEMEKKKKQCERLEEQLMKLKLQATDKEENKQIALGTSKLNYLDPRITVAWCKKYGVPIEKIYNKTQRDKFAWAIDMTNEDFEF